MCACSCLCLCVYIVCQLSSLQMIYCSRVPASVTPTEAAHAKAYMPFYGWNVMIRMCLCPHAPARPRATGASWRGVRPHTYDTPLQALPPLLLQRRSWQTEGHRQRSPHPRRPAASPLWAWHRTPWGWYAQPSAATRPPGPAQWQVGRQ